jgi:hypothetical protein
MIERIRENKAVRHQLCQDCGFGDTVPVIIDRLTGETHEAQIFVAVLGASNFTLDG